MKSRVGAPPAASGQSASAHGPTGQLPRGSGALPRVQGRGILGSEQAGTGPGGVDAWLGKAQVDQGKQHRPLPPLCTSDLWLFLTAELGGQHQVARPGARPGQRLAGAPPGIISTWST